MIKNSLLTALFTVTLCLSAVLLFSAQPMIAKLLLPSLGGTPAVWNTCMVFFQTVLLAGYAYGHTVATRPRKASQVSVHLCLILLALPFLPLALNPTALSTLENASQPVFAVMSLLTLSIGLPIFVISTTAPLLQRWYSRTDHPNAADPYFLYSASNIGSLAALMAYPTLIEPNLTLGDQRRLWSLGYLILGALIVLCTMVRWKPRTASRQHPAEPFPSAPTLHRTPPSGFQRFRWIALALVPSSWMLGITTYITTDIASVPLFWVIPLGLYLLTFILAFARKPWVPYQLCERILPIGAVALIYLLLTQATQPVWLLILIHLSVFFIAGLACHGRLAAERPDREHLTEFYFWISLGGVTGGMFNALLAPLMFTGIAEYPVTVVAGCLLRPTPPNPQPVSHRRFTQRLAFLLLPGLITASAALFLIPRIDLPFPVRMALLFGAPLIVVFFTVDVPWRFSLSLAGVLAASSFSTDGHGQTLFAERNFFGVLRVTRDPDGPFRRLVHGSTLHGRQFLDPARQCEPLSYYHRSGPLHYIFKVAQNVSGCGNVAVVGLGVGSTACYSRPDQDWTFYEINPAVVKIAQNTNYFTLLNGCMKARNSRIILGDARLRIRDAHPEQYELILLDAFSSDSIPTHLLTREAVELYLSKLSPDGLLAFHISNRTLNLQPVLGDLAASLGLICYGFNETEINPLHAAEGKDSSHWLVMARDTESLGNLPKYDTWSPVAPREEPEIWTDDYSQILSILNWN